MSNHIQEYKMQINALEVLKKHADRQDDITYLVNDRMKSYFCQFLSLYPCLEVNDFSYYSHPLFDCATSINHETYLSNIGSMFLVCGAISSALCGKIKIKINENWTESAIDQIVQFAVSGQRKSACLNRIMKPFSKFENKINTKYRDECFEERKLYADKIFMEANREIIRNFFNNGNLKCEDIERGFEYIKSNIHAKNQFIGKYKNNVSLRYCGGTICGLEKAMIMNGGYSLIINSEGGLFLNLVNNGGELILKSHTQEVYIRDTAHRRIEIPNPSLSIVICTQPAIANNLYSNQYIKDVGLLNRFMPFFHFQNYPSKKLIQRYSTEEYDKKIEMLLNRFYTQDINEERAIMQIEAGANELINQFQQEINILITNHKYMSGWLAKLPGQAARFACDIHCWNNVDDPLLSNITHKEMEFAILLAKASIYHAEFAFADTGIIALMDGELIISKLQNINNYSRMKFMNNPISETAFSRMTGLSHQRVRNALKYLEHNNYLSLIETHTGTCKVAITPNIFNVKI